MTRGPTSRRSAPASEYCEQDKASLYDRGRLLAAVSAGYNGELMMIDFSCMRVHQNGAMGKKGRYPIAA